MGRKSSYDAAYKAKVAIEAIKEQKTISEIAVEYKVSPSLILMMRAIWLIPSLRKTTTCSLSSILHDSPIFLYALIFSGQ